MAKLIIDPLNLVGSGDTMPQLVRVDYQVDTLSRSVAFIEVGDDDRKGREIQRERQARNIDRRRWQAKCVEVGPECGDLTVGRVSTPTSAQ
jgi:hypothetical protein